MSTKGGSGGARLGSFRSGDRSEYLATYALSRFAFVNPIPRQEDFGVGDSLCVLAKATGKFVYPESAFYVQIKANQKSFPLRQEALRWISHHMDHPLFICVADKKSGRIKIFSCARIWLALFPDPAAKRLSVRYGGSTSYPQASDSGRLVLGPPVIDMKVEDIERDPDAAYTVMRDWIALDVRNIARRRIGRIAVACAVNWKTNEPLAPALLRDLYFYDTDHKPGERELAPILTALAHSYRHQRKSEKLDALCRFLATVPPEYLDDHGRRFARGELRVEP